MKIDISQIVSSIGEPVTGSATVNAYKYLLEGKTMEAENILFDLHDEIYWSGSRNSTTDAIVAQICKERGITCNPCIVKEAVWRRIRGHISMAYDIMANGIKKKPYGKMINGKYRLIDGYNRVAMAIAMGMTEIDVE